MNKLHALYHRPLMDFNAADTKGHVSIEFSLSTVETVIRDEKPLKNFRTIYFNTDIEQLERLIKIMSDAAMRAKSLESKITIEA